MNGRRDGLITSYEKLLGKAARIAVLMSVMGNTEPMLELYDRAVGVVEEAEQFLRTVGGQD